MALYSVDWGISNYIAAAGVDGVTIIAPDGGVCVRARTPQPSFCVHMHPTDPSLLASSSSDGLVRVWALKLDTSGRVGHHGSNRASRGSTSQ